MQPPEDLTARPQSLSIDTPLPRSEDKEKETPHQEEKNGEENTKGLSRFKLYTTIAATCAAVLLMALNGSIVSTAIPRITSEFHSLDDIGWYGSASLFTTSCMQPLAGKMYTLFPIKVLFICFILIFSIGSLIGGVAASSVILIIGRAIQGIGGAGILNGAFSIIAAAVPPNERPFYVGIAMGLSTVGSVIGPLVGGALTQSVSWRWCFYINLPPSGAVIAVLAVMRIPENMEKKPVRDNLRTIITELDLLGFALFAPSCIMFLLAMSWGGTTYAWKSAPVIGLFCGAFGTFCVFVAWQIYRGEHAMIPPRIVRDQLVLFGCATSAFQMGALLLLAYYLPLWFQVVKGASPTMSGVMTLPTMISQSLASVIAGRLVQFIGYTTPWALFGSASSAVGVGLMTTFLPSTGAGKWIGYQILIGTGRGSVIQMPITAIQAFLPKPDVAMATSIVFFSQYFVGSVFLDVSETIFDNKLRTDLQKYAPSVDAAEVIAAGGTMVRSVVSHAELPPVLLAYDKSIIATFYLATAGSCLAFLTSFGMGFKKIPKTGKKKEKKEGESTA